MDAIYFGNIVWGFGCGNGPWVMADLESGLSSGHNARLNCQRPHHQLPVHHRLDEDGPEPAILGGNAQSGSLATEFTGAAPNGYNPMKKQGAIILGIGGDNSKGAPGPSSKAS